MPDLDCLSINDVLCIPQGDVLARYTRSGGPGGQHVNKTESAVELLWDVSGSNLVTEPMRARLISKLAGAIDSAGVLHVECSTERSQLRNRDEALRKLSRMVRSALVIPRKRKPTRPSAAAKERRLAGKKRDAARKRDRGSID